MSALKTMPLHNFIFIVLFFTCTSLCAQDTASVKMLPPERPHEIGVSVLTPIIMVAGATEYQERFSNLTYRQRITRNHAVRALIGAAPRFQTGNEQKELSATSQSTLYSINEITTPSNFQLGVGYELMWGGRLKPSVGMDLIYNNKFEKETTYLVLQKTEVTQNGTTIFSVDQLDSARTVRTRNFDKFGFNMFFSVRYEVSKSWCVNASTLMTFRYWRSGTGLFATSNSEFNMIGLLGDLSVFYKF